MYLCCDLLQTFICGALAVVANLPENTGKHRKTPQNTAKHRKTPQNAANIANWIINNTT
jgi:hypothetical protein